jgi:hypothetical protein
VCVSLCCHFWGVPHSKTTSRLSISCRELFREHAEMYVIELMQSVVQSFGLTSEIWTAQSEVLPLAACVRSPASSWWGLCFHLMHGN